MPQNLKALDITLRSSSLLILNTRWHLIKELRLLSWNAPFFQFGVNILGLPELSFLQKLEIFQGRPLDNETAGYSASLMHRMPLLRPSVSCEVQCNQGVVN